MGPPPPHFRACGFLGCTAVNKGLLSVLHLGSAQFFQQLVRKEVFKGILFIFSESNNLLTSSILTLLHTILQVDFVGQWWGGGGAAGTPKTEIHVRNGA